MWYITIRSDSTYSSQCPTVKLLELLQAMPELMPAGPNAFQSRTGSPSVQVVFAQCDSEGSYAVGKKSEPVFNVVELICSDGEAEWYEAIARRIAGHLGWEVVEEHAERYIWPVGERE